MDISEPPLIAEAEWIDGGKKRRVDVSFPTCDDIGRELGTDGRKQNAVTELAGGHGQSWSHATNHGDIVWGARPGAGGHLVDFAVENAGHQAVSVAE